MPCGSSSPVTANRTPTSGPRCQSRQHASKKHSPQSREASARERKGGALVLRPSVQLDGTGLPRLSTTTLPVKQQPRCPSGCTTAPCLSSLPATTHSLTHTTNSPKRRKGNTMKSRCLLFPALFLVLVPAVLASSTWYVNGADGDDSNNCTSTTTACKTIGRAIALSASGDSIMVAPSTYTGIYTINFNLTITGAGAATTILDGGGSGPVLTIDGGKFVLSGVTVQHGKAGSGGGIQCNTTRNAGSAIISESVITANTASDQGGGIFTDCASVIINKTTISNNTNPTGFGGGMACTGSVRSSVLISNTTFSGNSAGVGGGY